VKQQHAEREESERERRRERIARPKLKERLPEARVQAARPIPTRRDAIKSHQREREMK
jgi:hypothetical protein